MFKHIPIGVLHCWVSRMFF